MCIRDSKYTYSHIGYNLKISDMQAACGLAQLKKAESFVEARKSNFAFLKAELAGLEDRIMLPEATPNSDPSWFGFPITITRKSPISRFELIQKLDEVRIGTRLLFAGNLVRQPSMADQTYRVAAGLDVTDQVMHDTFWVGIHPALSEEMLSYVASVIRQNLEA